MTFVPEDVTCTKQEASKGPYKRGFMRDVCLLLDQIKREKGVWWMPWQ